MFIKVIPLSPILFNLFINFIFNKCGKYGILIGNRQCFGGLSPTRFQFKKLLKFASKWARNNEMQFGINKCASLVVVREEVSRYHNNSNPTFYLSRQDLPKMNCYTYLGECVLSSNYFRTETDHIDRE